MLKIYCTDIETNVFEEIKEFKAIPGFGVEGITKKGEKYLIGNKKLMVENNINVSIF